MAYYDALIAAWNNATQPPAGVTGTALAAGMSAAQKLAAVNAWTVAGPKIDVPVSAVVAYLGLQGKLANLQSFAASPPTGDTDTQAITAAKELVAVIGSPNAPAFGMSNAATYTTIEAMLNALASDTNSGIAGSDVTSLLALANGPAISWCQANGYPYAGLNGALNLNDCAAAGVS